MGREGIRRDKCVRSFKYRVLGSRGKFWMGLCVVQTVVGIVSEGTKRHQMRGRTLAPKL
jgi:hypothetical protein